MMLAGLWVPDDDVRELARLVDEPTRSLLEKILLLGGFGYSRRLARTPPPARAGQVSQARNGSAASYLPERAGPRRR